MGHKTSMKPPQVADVLDYWYGGSLSVWDRQPEASMMRHQFWWQGGPQMDQYIRETFGELHQAVVASSDAEMVPQQSRRELAEQALARIIVLSQFSRHIGRGSAKDASERSLAHWSSKAFENDVAARRIARWVLAEGLHKELRHYEKMFLNMPFVQSEDLADQDHAVQFVTEMNDIAIAAGLRRSPSGGSWVKERRDVVARFGRLPFRNAALGRESTPEEVPFLRGWCRGMA